MAKSVVRTFRRIAAYLGARALAFSIVDLVEQMSKERRRFGRDGNSPDQVHKLLDFVSRDSCGRLDEHAWFIMMSTKHDRARHALIL